LQNDSVFLKAGSFLLAILAKTSGKLSKFLKPIGCQVDTRKEQSS
jgi:hypothetical protein